MQKKIESVLLKGPVPFTPGEGVKSIAFTSYVDELGADLGFEKLLSSENIR